MGVIDGKSRFERSARSNEKTGGNDWFDQVAAKEWRRFADACKRAHPDGRSPVGGVLLLAFEDEEEGISSVGKSFAVPMEPMALAMLASVLQEDTHAMLARTNQRALGMVRGLLQDKGDES